MTEPQVPSDLPPPAPAPAPVAAAPAPRFLTAEDLGQVLGITSRGARLLLERGELPGFRLGRRWYLRPEDLAAAVASKVADRRRERDLGVRLLRGLRARPRRRNP